MAKFTKTDSAATAEMPSMEMPAAMRDVAEKTVKQAQASFENMKGAAEGATQALEASFSKATQGVSTLNAKVLETTRTNVNSAFDFFGQILGAKTVSEAVELHTAHLRSQFETLSAQAKEISTLAGTLATEAAEPVKANLAKTFKVQ